ncbi:hypothetical protein ILYODFUR_028686 [Ilyodon furcidens]|uniref:Uncharacterized protein n=1 Tax=Ilyodon furcidens TaxID=33524 RepID=A0ABV0U2Q6_9TELE
MGSERVGGILGDVPAKLSTAGTELGPGGGPVSDADGSEGGFQLKKEHALRVLGYISSWSQRQCLCCFKEYKHLEVFNQLVYALINLVITQINNLRNQLCSAQNLTHKGSAPGTEEARSDWAGGESAPSLLPQPSSPGEDEPVNVERDSAEEDANTPDLNQNKTQSHDQESSRPDGAQEDPLGPLDGGSESGEVEDGGGDNSGENQHPFSSWTTEEKEKLLICAAKIFQIQFPLYTAYKHNTHPTIEVRTNPSHNPGWDSKKN